MQLCNSTSDIKIDRLGIHEEAACHRQGLSEPDGVEHRFAWPLSAQTSLCPVRLVRFGTGEGAGLWEGLAQRGGLGPGGGGVAARVLFLQSLTSVFVSHSFVSHA